MPKKESQKPITVRIVDEKENDLFEPWVIDAVPGDTILLRFETSVYSRIEKITTLSKKEN